MKCVCGDKIWVLIYVRVVTVIVTLSLTLLNYCENHEVVFRYSLYDAQTCSNYYKTTRCEIVFAHLTYDVIQNGAENADRRGKNLKKVTLQTTGHPGL